MSEKSSVIFILRQASDIIRSCPPGKTAQEYLEAFSEKKQQQIYSVIGQFSKIHYIEAICHELFLKGVEDIIKNFPLQSIQDCIDLYERAEPEIQKQPIKDTVAIPPDLEALVAQYQENLASKNINDGKITSVAETVRRAREAMIVRERLHAIRQNREALLNEQELANYNKLLVDIVYPKAGNVNELLSPATQVISLAVDSFIREFPDDKQARLKTLMPFIVENTRYLALTEAIDISNHYDLITAISLSAFKADSQFTTSISDIYTELDSTEEKYNRLNQEISKEQLKLSVLKTENKHFQNKGEMTDHYLNEIALAEANIAQKIQERDTVSINLAPFTAGTEEYLSVVPDILISQIPDIDFDLKSAAARKLVDEIHEKLSASKLINPQIPPPEDPLRQAVNLEVSIRKELPFLGISLNATNKGQQTSLLLSDPKTQSKDLSGQTILLYSKGLTTSEFDQVISHAWGHQNDPNSQLGKLYKSNPQLFGLIRQQLSTIEKTDSPEAQDQRIRAFVVDKSNSSSALSQLSKHKSAYEEYLSLIKKHDHKQILDFVKDPANKNTALAKFYKENTRIFGKLNSEFTKIKNSSLAREISKPISKLTKSINSLKNSLSVKISGFSGFFSRHQSTINFVLNPIGSINQYFGHKAGQYITKRLASHIGSNSLGKLLSQEGLKGSLKTLSKKAAERLVVLSAKLAAKSGIKISAQAIAVASGIATFGFGLLLAVGIEIIAKAWGMAKKGLNWISQTLYGDDFKLSTLFRDIALGIGAGFTAAAGTAIGFITLISSASAVAASSALSTIIMSSLLGYFLFTTSILVAPIISTLAQLETQSNGSRATGSCAWPIEPGHYLTQGPGGLFSHSIAGYDQSIDISAAPGTTITSSTNGIVSFAGHSADYMNTDIVVVETSLTDGTPFQVVYAHLLSIKVTAGSPVSMGSTIIGTTGTAGTGPHLHFEYKGIKYNQCPAGGVQLKENCGFGQYPGKTHCASSPQVYTE